MFKIFFFAALVALAAAKPGLVSPLGYSSPLVSAYSGLPAVAAYSAHPAAYAAHPAAYSAYSAYPAVSAYSAYSSPLLRSSIVGSPVVGAYSAGVPLGYPGYY